jgi:hypothetical protein
VIRDVDATLAAWLARHVPGVRISFAPPGHETAKGGAAVLSVHLYGVREDADGSLSGWDVVRDQKGVVVGRTPPSRRYRLTYLLVATAADTLTEHDVLGRVLAGAVQDEVVPQEFLAGELVHAERDVLVRCAPATGTADPQHLWATWDCPARTALELSVLAPMPMSFLLSAPPPPSHIDLRTSRDGRRDDGGIAAVRPRPTSSVHEG